MLRGLVTRLDLVADRLHQGETRQSSSHFLESTEEKLPMVHEMDRFQQDLLASGRQMKAGKAARTTQAVVSAAAEVRAKVGFSQRAFPALLGVSSRTLQDWEQGRRTPTGAARPYCKLPGSIRRPFEMCRPFEARGR